MVKELLNDAAKRRSDAQGLRRDARAELDEEKRADLFQRAANLFEGVIADLERALRGLRRNKAGPLEIKGILSSLSQSYGSLGGTFRDDGFHKQGELKIATLLRSRDSYDEGNIYEEEQRRKYNTFDTYNLVQRLVIRLLIDPTLLKNNDFKAELTRAHEEIQQQWDRKRRDSWIFPDRAIVDLLIGVNADKTIENLNVPIAKPDLYESTYHVINALIMEKFGDGTSLGDNLHSLRRLLQRKGGLT